MGNTNRIAALIVAGGCAASASGQVKDAPAPPSGFPKFKVQEIATDLKIGYAVITCDVNDDKKPDIVVVDKERVLWYENPTWRVRPIITGKSKPDNVCIASLDIDGDKKIDFVVGAGWRPADTKNPGTLQWLSRGKTLDEEWTVHPIPCDEPTVHRVKIADIYGDDKPAIIMAPLQGRDSSAKGNWVDGRPVRIMAYKVPTEPTKAENWKPYVLNEDLHVVHNLDAPATFRSYKNGNRTEYELFAASYEGVTHFVPFQGAGKIVRAGEINRSRVGDQSKPKASRGSSEVTAARVKSWPTYNWVATVEPWHGNSIVFYLSPTDGTIQPPTRIVLDDHLRWGHAIKLADLDGDEVPEIIAGVRDNPAKDDKFTEKRGVRIYRNTDGKGAKWDRYILEDGGVAVEDLTCADLDGDGKPEIVAVGRATGNCRIYWNQGK